MALLSTKIQDELDYKKKYGKKKAQIITATKRRVKKNYRETFHLLTVGRIKTQ